MGARPLVSIVVPCYKQAHYLNQSLQSVLEQTFTNWECIIVNDGSPDNTKDVAMHWCKMDKRFRYVDQSNKGLSAARNTGIEMSKGKYILPLDADDCLHKNLLEYVNRELRIVSYDLIHYQIRFFGTKSHVYHLPKYSYKRLLVQNCFIAGSVFLKKKWKDCGGYDIKLDSFEDWDFWIRMLDEDSKVYKIEQPLYFYRQHITGNMRSRFAADPRFYWGLYDQIYEKHIDLYKKYFDHPIQVNKDFMDLEIFVDKIKRTWLFKLYHFCKHYRF